MSDSSEEEDLSRFQEAVDTSFTTLIDKSKGVRRERKEILKSERYLDESAHYNDVKVPEGLQKQIASKISNIINKQFEFVEVPPVKQKKRKLKGGVKLFRDSSDFLSCGEVVDDYTELHNKESKKFKLNQRKFDNSYIDFTGKIKAACIDGEYILSREETKCWKSRRKEKLFRYKKNGNSKVLVSVD